MKSFFALLPLVLIMTGGLGCRPESALAPLESEAAAPEFSAKSGLSLPAATQRALDLKLVEITEQQLETILPVAVRVYEINSDKILTAGRLTPEQTRLISTNCPVETTFETSQPVTGRIHAVRRDLRQATGCDEVLVEFPLQAAPVAPGAFLSATIRLTTPTTVVTIPRRALLENSEGQFAYTLSGEHFVRTAVQTGRRTDEFVEITDGLYAGDQIVLQPVMSLWLTELASVKGGQACCVTPPKGK